MSKTIAAGERRDQEKPVGAALMAPPWRRRGRWGAAVAQARALGLRLVTLQASEMGYPLYLGMGFRQVSAYEIVIMPPRGD